MDFKRVFGKQEIFEIFNLVRKDLLVNIVFYFEEVFGIIFILVLFMFVDGFGNKSVLRSVGGDIIFKCQESYYYY